MSEFHEGKVDAMFQIGVRIENVKEAYEKEVLGLDGMQSVLSIGIASLEKNKEQFIYELSQAQISIKEADASIKAVDACVSVLKKMLNDVDVKKFAAKGAIEALKTVIMDVKNSWDVERSRLEEIKLFEAQPDQDMKQRPSGYFPKPRISKGRR